nr:hypothetical protein BaRGS_028680 [Batillaria attramentaria]
MCTGGAAANYLCLPLNPEFDDDKRLNDLAQLYGGEYHTYGESTYMMDAVCAVCRPPRATVVMVPAATHCWSGWTLEYTGHLMAGRPDNAAASEFICVDTAQQARSASHDNENGKLLYYTATHCGSLPCPPYVNQKVVPCAVCTK